MNQQPDKFFRQKLNAYQQSAPQGAWSRVSQNLRKNRRVLWTRIAAAIAFLVASAALLYPVVNDNIAEPLAENKTGDVERDPMITHPSARNEKDSAAHTITRKEPQAPGHEEPVKRKPRSGKNPQTPKNRTSLTAQEEKPADARIPTVRDIADGTPEEKFIEDRPQVHSAQESKNVTIIFSAEEVNEKYLVKNDETEATPREKESSGLRKLLDKASDLTTNQDLIGDLRQKKNEILAMNFKSEKQKTEND